MNIYQIIANILMFIAGICSILSTQGRKKNDIVFVEFIGTTLRIIGNILVKSWTDAIAKVLRGISEVISIKSKFNKTTLFIVSGIYLLLSMTVIYLTKDLRYIIAIIPSLLEFYALMFSSTKKYRWYIIITKLFWTINNIVFKLYVGIVFDVIVVLGHTLKLNKKDSKES